MSAGAVRVKVDEHRCVGAGQCAWIAPKVFDQRASDGIVMLLQPHPGPEDLPWVREAVERCPARAITLEHDDIEHDDIEQDGIEHPAQGDPR